MKVESIQTYLPHYNTSNVQNKFNQPKLSTAPMQDSFEKSQNISFKGKDDDDWSGLGALAILIGLPILSSILAAKNTDPEYIFAYDGTYLGKVSDWKMDEEAAKDAGIDLSNDRFAYSDPQNGVFTNPETGIDINFKAGRYIDPEKGIFIDKETGMSAYYEGGKFHPMEMQNVNFKGFVTPGVGGGFGTPSNAHVKYTYSREEFIEKFGTTPEEHYGGELPEKTLRFEPIDRRGLGEKVSDFFRPHKPDTKEFDAWGREVVTVHDAAGNAHRVPLDDKMSEIIKDHNLSYEDVQHMITYTSKHAVAGYIAQHNPELIDKFDLEVGPYFSEQGYKLTHESTNDHPFVYKNDHVHDHTHEDGGDTDGDGNFDGDDIDVTGMI
jgi:hypothetical protein